MLVSVKGRRRALAALFVVGVSLLVAVAPVAAENPLCSDVVVVLDESGSIGSHEGTVRSAVDAFLDGVSGEGVDVAVVEFGTAAKTVFGYTEVTPPTIADTLGPYVFATGSGDVYDSPSQLGAFTNWDDALDEVEAVNGTRVAPTVLFLTDGAPTAYNRDHAGEDGGITTSAGDPEALVRAVEEADAVKAQGSHILAIGVGNALSSSANVDRLIAVTGPDVHDGTGTLDIATADVVLVPDFADLPATMATIAQALCSDPAIEITKDVDQALVVPGTVVTYTIVVTNTGNVDLHDVVVTDEVVPTCSATIGFLGEGDSVSYTCTTTIVSPLTNIARVRGTDPFDRVVRDRDDAFVDVVTPEGVGTPGYWKNHPGAWPGDGSGILVGDWNFDRTCGPGEECLDLSTAEAMAALATPPAGDVTYNVARPLVAAWLNIASGNASDCVRSDVDDAVAWLTTHPIGSDVSGGDPAWAAISPVAERLDDYNNGLLCAPHRDGGSGGGSGPATPPAGRPTTTTTTTVEPGGSGGNGLGRPPEPPGRGGRGGGGAGR